MKLTLEIETSSLACIELGISTLENLLQSVGEEPKQRQKPVVNEEPEVEPKKQSTVETSSFEVSLDDLKVLLTANYTGKLLLDSASPGDLKENRKKLKEYMTEVGVSRISDMEDPKQRVEAKAWIEKNLKKLS